MAEDGGDAAEVAPEIDHFVGAHGIDDGAEQRLRAAPAAAARLAMRLAVCDSHSDNRSWTLATILKRIQAGEIRDESDAGQRVALIGEVLFLQKSSPGFMNRWLQHVAVHGCSTRLPWHYGVAFLRDAIPRCRGDPGAADAPVPVEPEIEEFIARYGIVGTVAEQLTHTALVHARKVMVDEAFQGSPNPGGVCHRRLIALLKGMLRPRPSGEVAGGPPRLMQ